MEGVITRIQVCGPLELEMDGRRVESRLPGRQGGLVVAYLATNRARPVPRHELVELLWPSDAPADPGEALAALLSKVRRGLGREAIEGRGELRLAVAPGAEVDREVAAEHAAAGTRAVASREWRAARDAAAAALEIAQRGFLVGHAGPWVEEQRRELGEVEQTALETAARAGLALGGSELGGAERAARALVEAAPFRESGHRLLMETLGAAGNVAEALRVYDRLRILLRDELGTAPAAEVQALHARLLAGDGGRARPAPLPRLLAPGERSAFVGRDTELAALRSAWDEARAGRRGLVLLAGPPGIGKTRLTSEFAREAHEDGTVLYAGCQEDALVSYQPFVEALRHVARSGGFDPAQVAAVPGASELARLIPELAGALPAAPAGPPADPETRRYLLFDAVAALLAEVSRDAPLLLVLDDLHWADRATLHLLRHVIRSPHDASLLIVGTYREAEVRGEHPLAALLADLRRERLFERVSLGGLDEPGVGALIASHAGHGAPTELVASVHEQTEGNPFFVEEVMRHLIETGAVFERDGQWVSGTSAQQIGVPEGVKEVLARRLGRLSEDCQAILSHGSVLGRSFRFDVLAAMGGEDEDRVLAAMEEATEAQLVVEGPGGTAPSYAFTHALVRETLYGGLSGPRRERLHARAAQAIATVETEPSISALAVHHRLAGSLGSAEKAIELSLRAGAEAREVAAWDEAAAHWEGALDVLRRDGGREVERAALLVALSDLMVVTGQLAQQIDFLEQALALYDGLGDAERGAQVHSRLGMAHSLIDSIYADHLDIGRAFRHFDAARAVLEHGPLRKSRGHLETGVSTAFTYGLRMRPGIEAGLRGMEIGEQLGDDLLWAGAAQACGWHKIHAGELREGLDLVARGFEVADRRQRPFLAWMGSNILGQLTWGLGAPDEAQGHFERLLSLPYAGKTAYRQQIADGVGRCHASRGEVAEARRLLSDAKPAWITHSLKPLLDLWGGHWDHVAHVAADVLETSRRTQNRWDEWAAHHLAARVHHLRGDLGRAGERLEEALAIVVDGGASYFELWVRPDLARVRAEGGRIEEARAHMDRCRDIVARGEDWRGLGGRVALAEAVVLAAEDRTDRADASFAAARATLQRHRLGVDEAQALHEWGRALAQAGDGAGGAERLDEALELYRRLGAGLPWLDRVEADRQQLRGAGRGRGGRAPSRR